MLKTEQMEIQMDDHGKLIEMKLGIEKTHGASISVMLGHAEIIQLMHTLLEINRVFRGDLPFYEDRINDRERLR